MRDKDALKETVQRIPLGRVAGRERHVPRFGPQPAERFLAVGRVPSDDHGPRTGVGERRSDTAAEDAGSADHDGDPSVEPERCRQVNHLESLQARVRRS